MEYYCYNKCCVFKYDKYKGVIDTKKDQEKYNKRKSGGILYDKSNNKILLIQSRGKLWGVPKGTKHNDETLIQCAIREIKEETGLDVIIDDTYRFYTFNNSKSVFYYIPMKECDVKLQTNIKDNDATGITWVNLDCLRTLVFNDKVKLNHQTKMVLNKVLGYNIF